MTGWTRFAAAAAAGLALLGSGSGALAQHEVRVARVEPKDAQTMRAFVTVNDVNGQALAGLGDSAFEVTSDGVPVATAEPMRFAEAGEGVATVMLIDASGSMTGVHLQEAKRAAKAYVDQMGPDDRVAVIAFHNEIVDYAKLTGDRSILHVAIDNIERKRRGGTVLFSAIAHGLDIAGRLSKPATRVVLVMSDGKNEAKGYTDADCIHKANELGVPIMAVGYAPNAADKGFRRFLEKLARETHGRYHSAERAQDLSGVFSRVRQELGESYVIDVPLPDGQLDGKQHKLAVSVRPPGGEAVIGRNTFEAPFGNAAPASAAGVKDPGVAKDPGSADLGLIFALAAGGGLLLLLGIVLMRRQSAPSFDDESVEVAIDWPNEEPQAAMPAPVAARPPRPERKTSIEEPAKPIAKRRTVVDAPVLEDSGGAAGPDASPASAPRKRKKRMTRVLGAGQAAAYSGGALVVQKGGPAGARFPISLGTTLLGADTECAVCLPAPTISGQHARLELTATSASVEDLGSTNGTFVNDRPVDGKSDIVPGGELRLGEVVFTFEVTAA